MLLGVAGLLCFISQPFVEHLLEHQQKITPTSRPRGNAMRAVIAHANTTLTVVIELEVEPIS